MARPRQTQSEDTGTGYTSILNRSRKNIKPAGLVPTGVWVLRCLSAKQDTYTDSESGETFERIKFMHEPFEATDSVDPDEVDAINEETGKSTYDGRRLYTTFFLRNANDDNRLARMIDAHYEEGDEGYDTIKEDLEHLVGKMVAGEVYTKPAKGEYAADSAVRNWARVG